jgi:hypothetical protein
MVRGDWAEWDTLAIPPFVYDIDFINDSIGWVSGGYLDSDNLIETSQQIFHTTNGGKNWITQRDTITRDGILIADIDFYDENFGIATSDWAQNLITTDGGKYWKNVYMVEPDPLSGRFYATYSVQVPSVTTAYIIFQGEQVYKYTRDMTIGVKEERENANCIVYTTIDDATDKATVNVECYRNGNVAIQIFDMLGNQIANLSAKKESFQLRLPLDYNFHTGVYFVRISIDNTLIFNNKINVVK